MSNARKLADGIKSFADATAITIDSSERVGIGTSSPIADLSIVDASTGSGMEFQPEVSTDTNRITNFDRVDSSYKSFILDALNHQMKISGNTAFDVQADGRLRFGSNHNTTIATATATIHTSETRYYKLINYASGFMLDGRVFIHVNRNTGFNQTSGYRNYNAAIGGYNNALYGAFNGTGDSGEGGNAVIHLGNDEAIYLRTNPSNYGGAANCVIIGKIRSWNYDGSYVTSAP